MLNTRRARIPKRKNGRSVGRSTDRSVCSSGNIRYGIRRYEERVIGHNDRRSPGTRIFFGISHAGSAASYIRRHCDMIGWILASSLEREKFTVLAIKFSLNHYIDP